MSKSCVFIPLKTEGGKRSYVIAKITIKISPGEKIYFVFSV